MQHVREEIIFDFIILIPSKIEAAIILKIWKKSFPRSLSRLSIRVIAESGLLYTLTSIAAFCALLLSPDSGFLIANAIVCY
jgi:hypothetical protein